MKRLIIPALLFLLGCTSTQPSAAQTCPFISCLDSLASNVTVGSLAINTGYSGVSYSIVNGPGIIAGSNISGLKPGSTTVVQLVASTNGNTIVAVKVITVAPIPIIIPAPRNVVSTVCGGGKCTATYQDGSTSTF